MTTRGGTRSQKRRLGKDSEDVGNQGLARACAYAPLNAFTVPQCLDIRSRTQLDQTRNGIQFHENVAREGRR